jgi:hypothetical protein
MKKVIILTILFSICLCFVSCQKTYLTPKGVKTYQKPIDVIYVYQSGFGQKFPEYKIDLKNKKFWSFKSDGYENYIARNSSTKDEGFTFASNLNEDKIEGFILDSSRYGFTKWKTSYDNPIILDGLQWGVTILFSDGTKKQIDGSNAFPKTWKPMCSAFAALTGTEVLPVSAPDTYK